MNERMLTLSIMKLKLETLRHLVSNSAMTRNVSSKACLLFSRSSPPELFRLGT